MGQSQLSNSPCTVQVVELAATQIKSQTTVNLLFKVQLGRQGKAYLHEQDLVIDTHHKRGGQRGFHNLAGNLMLTVLRASLEYVACFCFIFFYEISLLLCGN